MPLHRAMVRAHAMDDGPCVSAKDMRESECAITEIRGLIYLCACKRRDIGRAHFSRCRNGRLGPYNRQVSWQWDVDARVERIDLIRFGF